MGSNDFYPAVALFSRTCVSLKHLGICLSNFDGLGLELLREDLGNNIRHLLFDRRTISPITHYLTNLYLSPASLLHS